MQDLHSPEQIAAEARTAVNEAHADGFALDEQDVQTVTSFRQHAADARSKLLAYGLALLPYAPITPDDTAALAAVGTHDDYEVDETLGWAQGFFDAMSDYVDTAPLPDNFADIAATASALPSYWWDDRGFAARVRAYAITGNEAWIDDCLEDL